MDIVITKRGSNALAGFKKFRRGIARFNGGKFFEAHEDWEELWLVERAPEKTFLQGLIQLAAAFHHHVRGNRRGAASLLAAGLAKLERFPGNCYGVDLARLKANVRRWAKALDRENDAGSRQLPQILVLRQRARTRKPSRPRARRPKQKRAADIRIRRS